MINKKWIHILGWLGLYFFWVMVFQKREFAFSRTATIEFCYLVFIAANYYFNIYFAVPKFLYKRRYVSFISVMIIGILITAFLRVPLALFLNKNYFHAGNLQPTLMELFSNSFLNIFIWVTCIVAGKLLIDRFQFQQYINEIEKQKEQAELDFLNAQFNPHFLFNSINSIYGHIDKHNTTARNMLLTFSEMLRYQLYDCNNKIILIDKEINYIKNYVALQRARKEENLIVELIISEGVGGFSIAPLLFIAFIENAFKYVGGSEDTLNKVIISLKTEGNALQFFCFNTKDVNVGNNLEHKGIGITNAKRRLLLLYPGKHSLDIINSKEHYEVTLKIQLS